MTRSQNKAQRLAQIEALLLDHPEGLTQSDLARRLGVNRSTINRNLIDLAAPVYEERGRIMIDRESYLINLRLGLHEAMAIHLAGRLMTTRLDRQNIHAASAFRKLGISLERLAPRISQFISLSANTFDDSSKIQDPLYMQILEKLTLAWAARQRVRLWYQKPKGNEIKDYTFCPFFIEVGAIGQSIYTIGLIIPDNEKRTFKLERIKRIEVTAESFEIPQEFDPQKLFDHAWGIWYTDQEPVEVVLKFSARVSQRIKETRWHPSERVETMQDGSVVWKAWIAEPKEMLPWVRGWGADCEVLEPASLLNELKREAYTLAQLYRIKCNEEKYDG